MNLTKYEANLIAQLLEDRAAQCNRNVMAYNEIASAALVAHYWNEQKDIASDLAIKYREVGKA